MANNILVKVSFLLSIGLLTLSASEQIPCSENSTLLEITGDVILTAFVDANYGQYCNLSSPKGFQQISTITYVVKMLNEYNYTSNVKLGLRIFDTCHNRITVFRQVLRVAIEQSYAPDYEIGLLLPSQYEHMMDYFRDYGDLPISVYEERDFTKSVIDILAHYLSTRYEIVDLVHANVNSVLDHFLKITKDVGICVKQSDRRVKNENYTNVTKPVIVAIGEKDDMLRWLAENEESRNHTRETWFLLSLDNSNIDDLLPFGSYVIKPEIPRFDLGEFTDEFLENSDDSAKHSPYLLNIGKIIIELVEIFQDVRRRNCSINNESDIVTQYPKSQREISDSDVYEILRMQPRSHSVRYVIATKMQHGLVDIASYEIEISNLRISPERIMPRKSGLCLEHLAENCANCTNFQEHFVARNITKMDTVGRSFLKSTTYLFIFLIAVICGTLTCCIIVIFITYRFLTKEVLDGNPALTIILVLANLFTLLTALPFCMTDNYFGAESLNAWKILLTPLAFGLTFSIMFSRAIFLALSISSVFTLHINGYLQSLVTFFMYSVQIAISIMYFVLNTMDSAIVARSLTFIALLGYDISLLIGLFVTCYFIIRAQRNYYEGRCFFGTAVVLLIIWIIWLMCYILIHPENRDAIVFFGIVATAYSINFGILIPRIYYMIVHTSKKKNSKQRFSPIDPPTNSIVNTFDNTIKQSRLSYDYVHPVREDQILRVPSVYPNYYGNSSPNLKYLERSRNPNHCETSAYNNYEYHAEIKETSSAYATPRTHIENVKSLTTNNAIYAQPKVCKSQRIILKERTNAETCNKNNSSPSSKLHVEMYPVKYIGTNMVREQRIGQKDEDEEDEEEEEEEEEDEEDEYANRVTRL